MKYREVTKKLKQLGCKQIRIKKSGSHRIWFNPSTGKDASIPDWGSKDLKKGTIRGILKQLEIDYQTFLKS